jgi:replication-associated recombination protein RarA
MKVVDRYNFVGRRRQLQNCLKALKIDTDKVGVILHGMGGLGKSTIASRLICAPPKADLFEIAFLNTNRLSGRSGDKRKRKRNKKENA